MGQRVKLVYEGPGQTTNLEVAGETGDGRLEPGREIEVSGELAKQLEASTPYWRRRRKPGAKKHAKAKAKATATPAPESSPPAEDDSGGEG